MPACRLYRLIALSALFAAVFALFPPSARALTQQDWMAALVDSLGRSFGLPDRPQADDYRNILQGKRTLRIEAEAARSADDEVSTLAILNFGPFSGTGWVAGASRPSEVHLRFTLPLDGRYRLFLALRRPGHGVRVGAQTFTADGGDSFTRVEVGEASLAAGPQEIVVTLPPGGSLDYLELIAPNLPAIAPDGGWQPSLPLTWEILAVTAVQALGLEKTLPVVGDPQVVEAETLAGIDEARVVEDAHLGQPSGGKWLRAAAQQARIAVPLTCARGGFYDIELTAMGKPLKLLINGHLLLSIDAKPYLDTVALPPVFLAKGANRLELTLPPGGGFDRITVKPRQSDLAALTAALGITAGGAAPTSADLDRLTRRLTATTR